MRNFNLKERKFNSSSLSDFMRCPRLFYWKWVRGLELKGGSPALSFGTAFHEALKEWYSSGDGDKAEREFVVLPSGINSDFRTKEWGEMLFKDYIEKYKDEVFKVIYLEKSFIISIGSRLYAGTIDAVVEWNKQLYVLDHKTSKSLSTSFFSKFRPSPQIDGYCYACRELMGRCSGAIINGISTAKKPTDRFLRDISTRTERDMKEFIEVFSLWTREMERCVRYGRYPKNTSNCHMYFKKCDFYNLCLYGEDEATLERDYEVRKNEEET